MPSAKRNMRISTCQLLEYLESRVLLHGLTIITHGYQPISDNRPEWLDTMGDAIKARAGATTAIYTLRLDPASDSAVEVTDFSRLSGPSPDSANSDNAETVLLLDWAPASAVAGAKHFSVSYLASVVMPYLLNPDPSVGLNVPLVEGAVHLLGHSRGAPFMSEVARLLGQYGIWVDQLTLFDPQPVGDDPDVTVKDNVIFADNYYQTSGNNITIPNGEAITGAFNVGPLKLGGAYSSPNGGTHNDVHLYYHGTVDTSQNANDGNNDVPNNWYANNNVDRALSGFYYARLGGGAELRPTKGIGTPFGGTGTRGAITTKHSIQWPNLALAKPVGDQIETDSSFAVNFDYASVANSKVQWFLDPDTNPYNGNSIAGGPEGDFASTGTTLVTHGSVTLTANASIGTYHLEGRITNGSQSRYTYSNTLVNVVAKVEQLVVTVPPTDVVAGSTFHQALTVAIQNSTGDTLTDNTDSVTISIASGPAGGTLSGTTTVQAVAGVAAFPDLILTTGGDYTLRVTSGTLDTVVTGTFTVSPNLASTQLKIVQTPTDTIVGKTLAPPLILNVVDQFGNVITTDKSKVVLSIVSGPTGSALKGTSTLTFNKGAATFSNLSLTQAGSYTLQLNDTSLAFTTLQFAQTVTLGITTVTAPKPAASYSFGQSFTLSTTFKSDAPTSLPFTGTAAIADGLGHTLLSDELATNGQAQFKFTNLAPGTYNCVISYPGDNNHTAATSPGFTLVINQATTKVNLMLAPTSLVVGQPFTLTANVTANSGGSTARTGSVSFFDNGVLLMTLPVDANSAAVLAVPSAVLGKHTYSASYTGDTVFVGSTSGNKAVTVNPNKTQIALTYTTLPLEPFSPFTLLAGVTILSPGTGAPSGTVTFKEGNTVLGTATLNGSTGSLVISYPAAGAHKITAVYSGDANSKTSTSVVLTLTITLPPVI